MRHSKRFTVGLAALAAGALGSGACDRVDEPPAPPPAIQGFVLPEPRKLPAVELVDEDGAPFAPERFEGRWSFIYFGYTYCPDMCPLALVELAALEERLAKERPATAVGYFLVTVDPQRDTPERLREYVRYFDPGFHGLTGSIDAISALARATETVFFVPPGQGPDHYVISHSNNFVLLNPAGDVEAIFTSPHSPQRLAADFATIVEYRAARD